MSVKNSERKIFNFDREGLFEILSGLFFTTIIVSNIASNKIASIGPVTFDAGTIFFPLVYFLGGVITEVYGFYRMRRLIIIGAFMLVLMSVVFWLVGALPAAAEWKNQEAYLTIMGVVWRISAASIVAITLGELTNSWLIAKFKKIFSGKKLWLRLIISTTLGTVIDTIIFSTLAFYGTISLDTLIRLIISVSLIKIAIQIALSPVTVHVVKQIKLRQ